LQVFEIVINIGLLVFGLVLLSQGSEYFVEAASKLAKSVGLSELVIGLTIVAVGTSLPEIVSSSLSIAVESGDLALGNILGSCIANLTLVVGLSALYSPLASNTLILYRDSKVMIFIIAVLGFTILDPITPARIVAYEGLILLVLFIVYVLFLFDGRDERESSYQFELFVDYLIRLRFLTTLRGLVRRPIPPKKSQSENVNQETEEPSTPQEQLKGSSKEVIIVILSCTGVIVGAQFVVQSAISISLIWGIEEGVIGLTVIAVGTSLPEIMVSVNSARRGFGRLLIGNVMGSNIVNVTLGIGFVVLIVPAFVNILTVGLLVGLTLLISVIFYYTIKTGWRVTRREGVLLLICYILTQIVYISILQFGGI
jgi:cation:H+ antiporter